MKLKDGLFSAAVGYIVTTFQFWETRKCIWLLGLMAAVLFWDMLIRIEEFKEKRNRAQRAATLEGRKSKFITVKL